MKRFTMLLALVLCAFTSSLMAQTYYKPGNRTTTLEAGKKYFIAAATFYSTARPNLLYNNNGTLAYSSLMPDVIIADVSYLFTVEEVGEGNVYYLKNNQDKYLQANSLTSTEDKTGVTIVPYYDVKGTVSCGDDVQACDAQGTKIEYNNITAETPIVCVYYDEGTGWRHISGLQTGKSTPFAFYEVIEFADPFEVTTDVNSPIYYTIKNMRTGNYAEYDGATRAMLQNSSVASAANLFYFTAGATEGTYKIHNAATSNKCAATNSWTADGIDWYIKQSGNATYSGLAIANQETLTDAGGTNEAWNDYQGKTIGTYGGNDAGSVWAIDKYTAEVPAIKMSTESEKHLYFIKNDRVNMFANYVASGTAFTETSASNYGSYWYFVEKTDAEDVPEGFKACYIYNAANDKPVQNHSNGYMSAVDDATYPAKVYLVGTHESTYWGYVIYPQGDTSGWNDKAGQSVTNWDYNTDGSIWSIISADKTEAQLKSEAATAKNNALTFVSHAEEADYYTYTNEAIATARAAIEAVDVDNLATATTGLLTSFETMLATLKATENGATAPIAGEYIWLKNRQYNKYLKANDGDLTSVADKTDLSTLWIVELGEGNYVKLKNYSTGKYIGEIRMSTTVGMVESGNEKQFEWTNQTDCYAVFHETTGGTHAYGHIAESNVLVGWEAVSNATQWVVSQLTAEEALADLQVLVDNTNLTFGTSIGLYARSEDLTTALNAAENLLNTNSTDVGAILDAKVALQAAVAAAPATIAELNTPATGKYYRLQNEASGNYMSGNASNITLLADGVEAKSAIFYLDENKALRAVNGKYLDCQAKGYADEAKAGEFGIAYGGVKAGVITYKNNGYWTYGAGADGAGLDRGSSTPNHKGYNWIITEAADPAVFEIRQALSALVDDAAESLLKKLPLQVENADAAYYLSSCGSADGNVEGNMIDGKNDTFYGSPWGASVDGIDYHYWQVDLGEGVSLSEFVFSYVTRANGSDMPTEIVVKGSANGENFEEITTISSGLPAAASTSYTSATIPAVGYRYLRFEVTGTNNNYKAGGHATQRTIAIAEFSMAAEVESLMTDTEKAVLNALLPAETVLNNLFSTADAINNAYTALKSVYTTLRMESVEKPVYPFTVTTDDENPVVYAIKSGRTNDGKEWWYTYDAEDGKIALTQYTGANEQLWFFKEVVTEDYQYALQLYPVADATKAMSYSNTNNVAGNVVAQALETSGYTNYWYLMSLDNGSYTLQTYDKTNYLSNYGGVTEKMGMWNGDAPSTDGGSQASYFIPAEVLQALIDEAEEMAKGEGTAVGYYTATSVANLNTAIATAKTNLENKDYTVAVLNTAISALEVVLPESGKYYQIHSGLQAFAETKAIYSTGAAPAWKSLDGSDKSFYWTITPNNEGTSFIFQNVGDKGYLNGLAIVDQDAIATTLEFLAPGEFNIISNGNTLHAESHGGGSGVSGNIINYGGGANGASSWKIIEVEHPDLATAKAALKNKVDELKAKVAASGTNPGWYNPTETAKLATPITTAQDVLDGGANQSATYTDALAALNNAIADLNLDPIPVTAGKYFIVNAKPDFNDSKVLTTYAVCGWYKTASTPAWAEKVSNDPLQYWEIEVENEIFYLKSAYEGSYITSVSTIGDAPQATTFTWVSPGQYNIVIGGGVFHANLHGYTNQSNIVSYGSGADNPSAWKLVAVAEQPSFTHDLTVGATRYATLMLGFNAKIPEGVTCYTAVVDGNVANLTQIEGGVLPANTPVLVKAEPATYSFTSTSSTGEVQGNELEGSLYSKLITPETNTICYVLAKPKAEEGKEENPVGFYKMNLSRDNTGKEVSEGATSFINGANKIYLPVTVPAGAQAAPSLIFRFGATDVENMEHIDKNQELIIYDLTGRRVDSMEKGIYIVNGRKVIKN